MPSQWLYFVPALVVTKAATECAAVATSWIATELAGVVSVRLPILRIVLVFAVGAAFTTVMELAIIQVAALLLTSRDAMEFAIRAKPMIALESAMELPM